MAEPCSNGHVKTDVIDPPDRADEAPPVPSSASPSLFPTQDAGDAVPPTEHKLDDSIGPIEEAKDLEPAAEHVAVSRDTVAEPDSHEADGDEALAHHVHLTEDSTLPNENDVRNSEQEAEKPEQDLPPVSSSLASEIVEQQEPEKLDLEPEKQEPEKVGPEKPETDNQESGKLETDNQKTGKIEPEEQEAQKPETEPEKVEIQAVETDEDSLPPEVDGVEVPLHWHAKPCVHISSVGGGMTEEELLPLFNKYGQITSVSFENEKHDGAVIRYEHYSGNVEEFLSQVRQALNGSKLGDRTLIVEPFRPDSLLFIGNLTLDIDDDCLHKMFEPHGKVERAFVLRNAEGRSKGYGFVEYSLKSQATAAKMSMGNINMDGRVLRVEWSDCRRVADMFSTVLFIDRLPREFFHIEKSLKDLFGKYGKVRDCHVAIGINHQYRGFAFIDFTHSISADKAHQALDGHTLEGSSIRVSFANPSKSAQSYKFRYGTEAAQAAFGTMGRGAPGPVPGSTPRGPSPMPLMPARFMSPARPGMMGMGMGMQFGRGPHDRGTLSPLVSSGGGMLGPGSGLQGRGSFMIGGNMSGRPGMAVMGSHMQRLPFGQGAVTITPTAIAQVATAQAKAREEEARARAEAAKQAAMRPVSADSMAMEHYQRYQQGPQQNYYPQQQTNAYNQQYKQPENMYPYQQTYQQSTAQQASYLSQYQQPQQSYSTQYYSQPAQGYSQQQPQQQQLEHGTQYTQQENYYQQASQTQQYGYSAQYGHHQGFQYNQQSAQNYGQTGQTAGQQYQQPSQQASTPYTQQNYNEQYVQQQQMLQQSYSGASVAATPSGGSTIQDTAQQQAYSYYQQQAQVQAGGSTPQTMSATTAGVASAAQQSYEAQWAAYYASQAAYQQQTATADVGQKRTADQMDSLTQSQASYNYSQSAAYQQAGMPAYQQQQVSTNVVAAAYPQQTVSSTTAYQQQPSLTAAAYQQQVNASGGSGAVAVVSGAASTYLAPASGQTGYDQTAVADGYQQAAAATQGAFPAGTPGQPGVAGAYDYKRARY